MSTERQFSGVVKNHTGLYVQGTLHTDHCNQVCGIANTSRVHGNMSLQSDLKRADLHRIQNYFQCRLIERDNKRIHVCNINVQHISYSAIQPEILRPDLQKILGHTYNKV